MWAVLGSVQTHKCLSTGKAPPSTAVPEVSEPWTSTIPKPMTYYFMRNCCFPTQSNLCPLDWCSCQRSCTVQRLENVYFSWGASASRTLWDKAAAWHVIWKFIILTYSERTPFLWPNLTFFRSCFFRNFSKMLAFFFPLGILTKMKTLLFSLVFSRHFSIKGKFFCCWKLGFFYLFSFSFLFKLEMLMCCPAGIAI